MKYLRGKIKLEDKIINIKEFTIYPKTKDSDLETLYDEFISYTPEIREYFAETNAFDKIIEEIKGEKRPKLIAREPTRIPISHYLNPSSPFKDLLYPDKKKYSDKYFFNAHCIINFMSAEQREIEMKNEEKNDKDIFFCEKFKNYPNYNCIIEIPNDEDRNKTKRLLFHEGIHYLNHRYRIDTKRSIGKFTNQSDLEKYRTEHALDEFIVEAFEDFLLRHDKDALFESRYDQYIRHSSGGIENLPNFASAIATAAPFFFAFSKPYLLPLVFVPGRIKDYWIKKRKEKIKPRLLSDEFNVKFNEGYKL